jgi:hypothetical protein
VPVAFPGLGQRRAESRGDLHRPVKRQSGVDEFARRNFTHPFPCLACGYETIHGEVPVTPWAAVHEVTPAKRTPASFAMSGFHVVRSAGEKSARRE